MSGVDALTVLGSTGSIGSSTLDVLSRHSDRFRVFALTANTQVALLAQQCARFEPRFAVVMTDKAAQTLRALLAERKVATEVLCGLQSLIEVASAEEANTVVAAIVGAAGLEPTMAAVGAGKKVLLANKEALVMGGRLFTSAVKASGAVLLPVDSEHNAIFQCLPSGFTCLQACGVRKILLTGSGGPFRETDRAALTAVTPAQAVAHPNWSMGRKISVDSATMMNKGLEFIEACWLFDAAPKDIEVVVHPQSIIHSMVEYLDGSIVAQMGRPDMRTPIAHCLAWPQRINAAVEPLDLFALRGLDFYPPDFGRFPCLKMAMQAMSEGGSYPVALNAANEIAVDAFLDETIGYLQIAEVLASVMDVWRGGEPESLLAVKEADFEARLAAESEIDRLRR